MSAGAVWATVLVIVALLIWWARLWLFPWRDCPRCTAGKIYAAGSTVFRVCGRCKGTRKVRRLGARKEQ